MSSCQDKRKKPVLKGTVSPVERCDLVTTKFTVEPLSNLVLLVFQIFLSYGLLYDKSLQFI